MLHLSQNREFRRTQRHTLPLNCKKTLISKPTKVLFLQSLSKSPNTCCRLGLVLQELRSTAPESDAAEAAGASALYQRLPNFSTSSL
jgi:hypothetical protein